MFHIVLLEPEIPPNTGNIARLCAATVTRLHLVGRLGFSLDDRYLKRAGLDYWDAVDLRLHHDLASFESLLGSAGHPKRLICFSAHATTPYTAITFEPEDGLMFGCESSGLPSEVLARYPDHVVTIPMRVGKVRSLNLSTTAGIALYEGLRQLPSW